MSDQLKTKGELNLEIKKRYLILHKSNIFFGDSVYLVNPKTTKEREELNRSGFYNQISYSMWVIAVLEMCKLFGKKGDYYTLIKLLNKLHQCPKEVEWDKDKGREIAQKYYQRLDDPEILAIIEKIQGLRDQYYAHLDKDPKKTIQEFSPDSDEFKKLIHLAYSILNEISTTLLDMELARADIINKIGGNILNDISELRERRDKELIDKLNQRKR